MPYRYSGHIQVLKAAVLTAGKGKKVKRLTVGGRVCYTLNMDETTHNRSYKDSVFVDLFSTDEKAKERFLSLYNALHGTELPLHCPV